jgi:hypothetical protein
MEVKSAKRITFDLLDEMEDGSEFAGSRLELMVRATSGQMHYPSTMLRYMREYRSTTGRTIACVNKARSIYRIGESK